MKKTKQQNAITLIALIITIVLLLILAVVSIGAVQDSNIIAHAQNAAVEYNEEKGEEHTAIKEYEAEIEKYIKEEKDRRYVGTINGDLVILVLSSDNEMTITADGTVLAKKIKPEEISAPEGFPNSENYSQFYKSTVNGIEMICGMSKDGKTVTILGMGDLTLNENIFVTNPKTRVYEMSESNTAVFIIIKPNGTYKDIIVQNGEILFEREIEIEIKEFYTVKIAGSEIGTYRYVTIGKNEISDFSGGVDSRISENGEELYTLSYNTGENNVLGSYNWSGPYILNENITEEMIYQQYPKAQ